jgi:uncharacterized protein YjbI with pentapeptide repeats
VDFVKEATAPDKVETTQGLIPAEELPSAADAFAELFPEDPAPQVAEPETVLPAMSTPPDAAPRPKRRNIFLRLFSPKRPSDVQEEPSVTPHHNGNRASEERATEPSLTPETSALKPPPEPSGIEVPGGAEPAATPIAASDLPSAAQVLAELFPPEAAQAEVPEPVSGHAERLPDAVAIEAGTGSLSPGEPVSIEASTDAVIPPTTELASASVSVAPDWEATASEPPVEDLRGEAPEGKSTTGDEHPDETCTSMEGSNTEIVGGSGEQDLVENLDEENAPQPEEIAAESATRRPYKNWAFDDKLASHKDWIDSHGLSGKRADLAGVDLEAADLISVNLRLADLHDANLRAADLLLADLRDACLVRADLEDACLVGANLEAANLEGASLETAMGLVPRQIAGANLRDALLPPQLMEFQAETAFTRSARSARRYFGAVTGASILSWLVIWRTKDVQLLTDASVIPFIHSRGASAAVPTAEFYLIFPVALLSLYVLLHFHLQRVWDAVEELPAIFPDGRALGDDQPGIITGLLRAHFRWMNPEPSASHVTERSLWQVAVYWVAPATLLLFWARYLTRQEIHGTLLQAMLAVVATGIAFYATTKVGRAQEKWAVEWRQARHVIETIKAINPLRVAGVLALVLILLSVGTIDGVPHERSRAPQYSVASIRRWAPSVFWWLGFDPYADLTEASISRRPPGPAIADDQLDSVDGARLNSFKMRYAQAYEAFLAGAHLWHADLQGAFLSEADLRGADLGQSNLRYALMDQAHLYRANLDRSHLDGADLRRADLHEANLSYCSLTNAILADARLDGANLYTSNLNFATLTRANIQKADLRNASLSNAHMDHADLRGAYLWSSQLQGADLGSAQLGNAIFIEANLEGANLGGAQFFGTVLNGANLHGTSLEGADLRGASGLTANQVCSAKSRRGALLSDDLQMQVDAQCGRAQ